MLGPNGNSKRKEGDPFFFLTPCLFVPLSACAKNSTFSQHWQVPTCKFSCRLTQQAPSVSPYGRWGLLVRKKVGHISRLACLFLLLLLLLPPPPPFFFFPIPPPFPSYCLLILSTAFCPSHYLSIILQQGKHTEGFCLRTDVRFVHSSHTL